MSAIRINSSDRPPDGGGRRWWLRAGLAALALTLVAGLAWAQPPRTDPGSPPPAPGDAPDGWQIMTIPNLATGTVLGDVWVSPNQDVYVWGTYPAVPRTTLPTLDDPPEGEKLPNGGGGNSTPPSSVLYLFNGTTWIRSLMTPGETGQALYGTGPSDVWASTTGAQGDARLYHFDGTSWSRVELNGYYIGRMHTLAGGPGDVYFRINRVVMHQTPVGMQAVFEQPGDCTPVYGLVYLGADGLIVQCSDGITVGHGNTWTTLDAGFSFTDIRSSWGMRDEHGILQMYALGTNENENGIRMWRYAETNPATHEGTWFGRDATVISDPPGAGIPGVGEGNHTWGVTHNDIYATGVVAGEGHIFHFDGTTWSALLPPIVLGDIHGVGGTSTDGVWFSTTEGRMVRYHRANHAPDLTAAGVFPDRLWPPDGSLVPVTITGIVDPDNDQFTITINSILQDEAVAAPAPAATCPDASIVGGQVFLRAEHMEGGDGRVYDINYTVTDRLGLSSSGNVKVCAPHYVSAPCSNADPATFDALASCGIMANSLGSLQARERGDVLEVQYALNNPARIHLGVYDISGRLMGTVQEGEQAAGAHSASWNLSALHSGVYFLKLRAGGPALTWRVVVLR